MAFLSESVPSTAVYLVIPLSIAILAESLIYFGVSKSGSPTVSTIISSPFWRSSFALDVNAIVEDG